jgi:hypothetical protein
MSLVEALTNLGVGFVINVILQIVAAGYYGVTLTVTESAAISLAFTGFSLARSYILRRLFESIRVGAWTISFQSVARRMGISRAMQKHPKREKPTGDYTPAGFG